MATIKDMERVYANGIREGIRKAAEIAAEFDEMSNHDLRVSDEILFRLGHRKRRRPNKSVQRAHSVTFTEPPDRPHDMEEGW
jgi:hypothetical protein